MSSPTHSQQEAPLDLSKLAPWPGRLIGIGALITVAGLVYSLLHSHDGGRLFGFAWLVAYLFGFSLCLGGLFLVLVHHLFDAGWSVPIRRITETLGSLMPVMFAFFIPIAILAPKLYKWMQVADPATDHALHAKLPLFTKAGFYLGSLGVLAVLSFYANALRKRSIQQDATGAAECTHSMRRLSYFGIFFFAFLVTLGVILWSKALQHQWFSTMYGVYYFAGSVWTTLATVYTITVALKRSRILPGAVLHKHQFYYIGCLFFAFTVFYAYVTFAQYFIIWNANMPEETFWYLQREGGGWFGWKGWSMIIIFGHFFLPFLGLLRIDVKENFCIMAFFTVWAWLMHFVDMVFNVLPVASPNGLPFKLIGLAFGCTLLVVGVLAKLFIARYNSAAPYPLKDPRLIEAMGQHLPCTPISGGEVSDVENYSDGELQTGGK